MLNIKISPNDDLTIEITGDFDAEVTENTRSEFEDIAASWKGNITVDLSAVDFLDSSGIGAIVFLSKRLAERDRTISLSGVSGQPKQVIKMLRIDRSLPVEFAG